MADRVGQQLGNYRLIRLLGEGGFAEVYLGEHIYLKTQAAIKVLQMHLANEDSESFLKEARTIAGLQHPHIVRVFDFGFQDQTPYLVMEYLPNGTLRRWHPKGTRLPLEQIVSYVKQLAPALDYAHQQRVIHRDVKPENLLLDAQHELVLSDFGIALVTQSSRYQSTQEVVGTAAYMAPEQLQGKPRPASDQYSLGIVVYEWMCGDRPFHGTFTELYSQHLFVPPPPLREKVPTISPAVEQVVLTALQKDPYKRFASVQAFAIALEQACQAPLSRPVASPAEHLLSSHPSLPTDGIASALPIQSPLPTNVVTPPSQSLQPTNVVTPLIPLSQPTVAATPTHAPAVAPPPTEESIPSGRSWPSQPFRHRISRRAVVGSLVGLVIVGGGITWLALSQRSQIPSPSFRPTATLSPMPSARPLGTTLLTYRGQAQAPYGIYAAVWSPDGTRIASSAGTVQIWDATDGGNVLTHHAFENNYDNSQKLAWSPDGTRIVSIENLSMEVWTAKDGAFIAGHQSPLGWGDTLSWSPDNQKIVSGSDEQPGSAEIWNAASGQTMLTYRGHVSPVRAVAWSPNGKWIVSSSMGKLVHVWDATNANQVYIYSGHPVNGVSSVAWSPDSRRVASAGDDGTVHVWDASSGSHVYIYRGHFHASDQYHYVTTVAWSPDGTRIASGDWNHLVQIWDAVSGNRIYTYTGHSGSPGYITSVAWSPDSKRIASASRDGTVQVWQAV